jgi:hypothetical protein
MNWFRKQVVEIQQEVPQRVQTQVPVKLSAGFDQEYAELSAKLGITSFSITYPVYPLTDVIKYLDSKFGESRWVWVPLRCKDIVKARDFNDTDKRTYIKPIPFPVLKTIEEIEIKYPQAKFFISDEKYAGDEKDPFLMFTIDDGLTLNVVERWDEPSFR